MTQMTGNIRPGGRTARTREAVHAATRALLEESTDGSVDVTEVAARAGVHVATIYRRWRSAEGLIIDTVVADLATRSPLPATGDLRADMLSWANRLLGELRTSKHLALVRAMIRAGHAGLAGYDDIARFAEPRVRDIEATLQASAITAIAWQDVFDIIIAPAYMHALMANPLDPTTDAPRLVDNLMAVHGYRTTPLDHRI